MGTQAVLAQVTSAKAQEILAAAAAAVEGFTGAAAAQSQPEFCSDSSAASMCCSATAFSTHFLQAVCLRAEIRPARLVAEPGQLADEILQLTCYLPSDYS